MEEKLWTQRGSYFYSQNSLDFMYIKISYWNYFWHCHHSWYRSQRKEAPGSEALLAGWPSALCQHPARCGTGWHLPATACTPSSPCQRRRAACLALPVPQLGPAASLRHWSCCLGVQGLGPAAAQGLPLSPLHLPSLQGLAQGTTAWEAMNRLIHP